MIPEPEARHRACWYGRRTPAIPDDLSGQTIEDGELLFCSHPLWFPVVGLRFDVRSCASCEFHKPTPHRRFPAARPR
jgi:hypothetical protein